MRDNIKLFVRAFAEAFEVKEPICEFGSLQIGTEGYADLRPYFPGKTYIGCDMREGPGVDRIEDLASLSMSDKSVGTVICMDTIEHVYPLFRAFDEMYRVLKDEGSILVSSVMDFGIHSHPNDYWRFTPDAFEGLLEPYQLKIIGSQGLPDFPHTVWAAGFKKYHSDLQRRAEFFCKTVDSELVALEKMIYQSHSMNGKFKALRKRLRCKVFGPQSEYRKVLHEYKTQWKIVGVASRVHV